MGIDKSAFPNGIKSTPRNTMGMGNPMLPGGYVDSRKNGGNGIGNTGKDFHKQTIGSGDKL